LRLPLSSSVTGNSRQSFQTDDPSNSRPLERPPKQSLQGSSLWTYQNGEPHKTLVYRTMQALAAAKLVKKQGEHWELSKAGQAAVPRNAPF
jgi:hypothetical protein